MFEQQLYSFEGPVEPSKEGDLFHSHEVGSWNISTRIYQILAISLVLNLAVLGFVGQAELLTTRGCDSPFVGRVCQVLDMAYVGTVLFGTDREYVDAEYERTDLGDAEITYIDVSGVQPPFEYPEGFFYREPTAETMTDSGFIAPGIPVSPSTSGSSIFDTQANAPKYNPNAVVGPTPSSPIDLSDTEPPATGKKRRLGGKLGGNGEPEKETASTEESKNPGVTAEEIAAMKAVNSKPFKDLADEVNKLLVNKEVNLESQFHVNVVGKLNKEGKFEKKSFKYLKAESSDPKMIPVVKRSIEAFNESGFLEILKDLEGRNVNLELKQDQENITAVVQSELERDTRASSLKGIIKFGLDLAISKKEKDIADLEAEAAKDPKKAAELQSDRDNLELLKKTTVSADGKKLVINFAIDKEVVQTILQRMLAERAAENKESGNAQATMNSNTAVNR